MWIHVRTSNKWVFGLGGWGLSCQDSYAVVLMWSNAIVLYLSGQRVRTHPDSFYWCVARTSLDQTTQSFYPSKSLSTDSSSYQAPQHTSQQSQTSFYTKDTDYSFVASHFAELAVTVCISPKKIQSSSRTPLFCLGLIVYANFHMDVPRTRSPAT